MFAIEQIGEHAAAEMRRLRAGPDGQHVGRRIVAGEHGARLQRHAAAAMLPEHFLENMRGAGKGGIDVAIGEREARDDIRARSLWARARAVLDRGAAIGRRRRARRN